jgi:ABC-type spermidine/putrescine transport system permease subunit I
VPGSDLRLVLPLAALFVAFFVAPLVVLLAMSVSREADMHVLTLANYAKFFTDPFNYSILWGTLALGVKATLLCLLFGYPLAWIANRAGDVPRVVENGEAGAAIVRLRSFSMLSSRCLMFSRGEL